MDFFFLTQNSGSPWKTFNNSILQAGIASDAAGKACAEVVDFPCETTKITSAEFQEIFLSEDIQVKKLKPCMTQLKCYLWTCLTK